MIHMVQTVNELIKHPVFYFFNEISAIPRESGNEKKISDYLVSFAKERSLEVIQDEALNVIIKKPATKGYEHAPAIILQGHMDMVCELNKGTVHDFEGKIFINLDTEEDGKLLVSSAGGVKGVLRIPVDWESSSDNSETYSLSIGGLRGGHSGMEIDKERGNANKLLGRVLYDLQHELPYSLSSISGGLKSNAIPRESEAILSVEPSEVGKIENKIREWNEIVKNELQAADPSVYVKINKSSSVEKCFTKETTERIVQAIMLTPNGVQSMSMNIEELVESSTNLGVITTTESEIVFQNEIRSSVKSLKEKIVSQVHILAQVIGGRVETKGNYPEWAYNGDSKIRELCKKVYKEKYGEEAEIIAIHAGIECGIFLEKIPGLDAISLGPDMYDVHTPDEHLSIPSTIKTWEYLLAVLKEANKI